MSVALTETAMIALDRWFDETRRVTGSTIETVLAETKADFARLNRRELRRDSAFGRGFRGGCSHMPLNSGTNQRAQLVVVHST